MTNAAGAPQKAGLEDVVVSTSDICFIGGPKGRLVHRGFDGDDLVARSTFEQVIHLLWHGRLPTLALGRAAGWTAHVLEQHGNNRLIRPRAEYTGALEARHVPPAER